MRPDLVPGHPFPDLRLPDHTGAPRRLSLIADDKPLVLAFVRGWWCPKDQIRVRNLVAMQDEIQREYGRIAAVTVDSPYVNGAFRAGIGADFPFLSDEDRFVADELDIVELTDEKHRPFLPLTFILDSQRVVRRSWNGFWYWGNPTPDEIRTTLREITRAEQPSFDPVAVWANGGAAAPAAGIDAPVVWIREDSQGNELWRGAWHDDALPEVGQKLARSTLDRRWWTVVEIERGNGHIAIHQRKQGGPDPDRHFVRHDITVPPARGIT
jgi:peroxiredoxin